MYEPGALGKLKARDTDLGENNLQMEFKAMGLDESLKYKSEEEHFKDYALFFQGQRKED